MAPRSPTRPATGGRPTTHAARQPLLGRPPVVLLVPACIAITFLALPLLSLVLATPWQEALSLAGRRAVWQAFAITGIASLSTVAACLVFGTPLAWLLARVDFRGRSVLRALVTVPLVLPPVAGGVALLSAFGRNGLVGGPMRDLFDITLPFTTVGVVVAHTFVALPFFVLSVEGALLAANPQYDVVAATLGADRWTTFRRVTLPLVVPGIVAGSMLAWARSVGEFGATMTFAGNYPGTTQTMPSLIYQTLQGDSVVAQTLSTVLLCVALVVLMLLRNRWLMRV